MKFSLETVAILGCFFHIVKQKAMNIQNTLNYDSSEINLEKIIPRAGSLSLPWEDLARIWEDQPGVSEASILGQLNPDLLYKGKAKRGMNYVTRSLENQRKVYLLKWNGAFKWKWKLSQEADQTPCSPSIQYKHTFKFLM